jgi:hypothetical protein
VEALVSVEVFRDDDAAYLAWLAANPRGYVINIQRALNPADARAHHAGCLTITGTPARGRTWTGPYVKACSGRYRTWTPGRLSTLARLLPGAARASRRLPDPPRRGLTG